MSDELGDANRRLTATLEQLKSTQAQLLQAEKLSAIGQLVAGVAHELNNPLTSVIGYAQLLDEELLEPGPRPTRARRSNWPTTCAASPRNPSARPASSATCWRSRGVRRAARAPQDIADVCQPRAVAARPTTLQAQRLELTTDSEPGCRQVVADAGQIQQALLNLILNAEQAMRGGDRRQLIASAARSTTRPRRRAFGHRHAVTASTRANLSRIFDPFFTTRDVGEGTGLGLSICYGIVRDHGGQIRVESRVQAGTTFSVLLPARLDEASTPRREILVAHADQSERDFICRRRWWLGLLGRLRAATPTRRSHATAGRLHARARRSRRARRPISAGWSAARADDAPPDAAHPAVDGRRTTATSNGSDASRRAPS